MMIAIGLIVLGVFILIVDAGTGWRIIGAILVLVGLVVGVSHWSQQQELYNITNTLLTQSYKDEDEKLQLTRRRNQLLDIPNN